MRSFRRNTHFWTPPFLWTFYRIIFLLPSLCWQFTRALNFVRLTFILYFLISNTHVQSSGRWGGGGGGCAFGWGPALKAGRSRLRLPISVAERSRARVCRRWLAGIADSYPAGSMDISVVCYRGISGMRTEEIKRYTKDKQERATERKENTNKKRSQCGVSGFCCINPCGRNRLSLWHKWAPGISPGG
jgi:hypothetical protein